ncbi:MAG: autotransporter-associated beta strand repeat-containing protein [Prosthecobacter sp.]|nr:autotransporter-associated beta strand repeat-containing protein [Prosthecobacter sp.]
MPKILCLVLAMLFAGTGPLPAQLTLDGDTSTSGIQNGSGAWNLSTANWWDGSANVTWNNDGATTATFGTNTGNTGGTITVSGTINVGGMKFNPLSALPVTIAHTFTGGTLAFADNAVIEAGDNTSSGSTTVLFLNLNSVLTGNNLTIQRAPTVVAAQTFQYVRFAAANPNLTGTLSLKATTVSRGIFLLTAAANTVSGVSDIVVESGSVFAAGGTSNTYANTFSIAGIGSASGAIRVDSSSMQFTGQIKLTADAAIHTNGSVTGTNISGSIVDSGGSFGFQRTTATINTTLTLSGSNTYTGATTLGRSGAVSGGNTILDFAAATAPSSDILYNGKTAGALNLWGGAAGITMLTLQGKANTANSQRFGAVTANTNRSNIILAPGANGGSMTLAVGAITHATSGSVGFVVPTGATITTTAANGLLGPWATLSNGAGSGSWAGVSGGALTGFTGDLPHQTGTPINALSVYSTTSNLSITSVSSGNIQPGGTPVLVGTVTMADSLNSRVLDIGAGNILRTGTTGGIQITSDGKDFVVGLAGSAGTLSGSTAASEMWLTNMSATSTLAVNSVLANNGSGVLSVFGNGVGNTVLNGNNTFTGAVRVGSGSLEATNSGALGTSAGGVTVLSGAALRLAGNITLADAMSISGFGINNDGVIRNLSGDNSISGLLTQTALTRINSDAGTLTLAGATAISPVLTGNFAATFSGSGNVLVTGRIGSASTSTLAFTKEGTGTLTLQGSNNNSGITTLNAGILHLDFSGANAPATNILYNGITAGAFAQAGGTLQVTGKGDATNSQSFGAYTLSAPAAISVVQNGAASVMLNFTTITRSAGTILKLDLPTAGFITTTSGANNALLTGTGGVAYATVGLNDWAGTSTLSGGVRNIVGLSTLGISTPSTATTLSGNADIASGVATTTLSADTSITSLRFNQNQGGLTTVTQDATGGRYLTTGGILVTPDVGANDVLISTGALRAPASASDLIVIQNNTAGALRISAKITNNASTTPGTTTLTKSGPGLVIIESNTVYNGGAFPTAYYTGGNRIQEGSMQFISTSGAHLNYPVYSAADFYLGSGTNSGKLVIGGGTVPITLWGGLRIEGTGTTNSVVGGSSALSGFHNYFNAVRDFRKGFFGGSGANEDNLSLTISVGTFQLGPNNTFAGKTTLLQNTLEVEKLANSGLPSSLGRGDFNAASAIIEMASYTTSTAGSTAVATLRYTGSTDSLTNRVIHITNSDVATDITAAIAVIENAGTGALKFTSAFTAGGSNPAQRTLRLEGTNIGANEIVGIGNASGAILTGLIKNGAGTWILTGDSTYGGGTTVNGGKLLVANTGSGASATGTGPVTVQSGATFGGVGRIALATDRSITINGGATLSVGNSTLVTPATGTLELVTSGIGTISLNTAASFALDLISRGTLENPIGASDTLKITVKLSIAADATLKVANLTGINDFAAGDQWKLFDWSGLTESVNGSFTTLDLPGLGDSLGWDLNHLYSDGFISIVAVPEPSRSLLLFCGVLTLQHRRRRA